MSEPARYRGPGKQGAASASQAFQAALVAFLAIVVLATPRCIMAADPCQDVPSARENTDLTLEEAADMAERSSPSVASARRALKIALLQLRAAEAERRPSITVHASPLRIQAHPGDAIPDGLGEGGSEPAFLSQAGGEVQIPLGSGKLSLSANLVCATFRTNRPRKDPAGAVTPVCLYPCLAQGAEPWSLQALPVHR